MTPASATLFFTPASPSILFAMQSPAPLVVSPTQRMDKLAHCLQLGAPSEIVYPSFGQVSTEAERISTFLDLYRVRAQDENTLNKVKSPATRDAEGAFVPLGIEPPRPRRRGTVRRSRSLDDLQHGIAITSDVLEQAGRAATMEENFTQPARGRRGSLRKAQETIVQSDAERMAAFRTGFGIRPRQLAAPLPPPTMPLPSPPPPSALLKVKSPPPPAPAAAVALRVRTAAAVGMSFPTVQPLKVKVKARPSQALLKPDTSGRLASDPGAGHTPLKSPQAPYWVKPVMHEPKTPRTMRSERRQGWGGAWTMGPMGQVVGELKEA